MAWIEYEAEGSDYVEVSLWGKDHWSVLAYLETCAVDHGGTIDSRRMRCDPRIHRELFHSMLARFPCAGTKYPTRLAGGKLKRNHDDWSCLEDMVACGMLRAWFKESRPGYPFGDSRGKIEFTTFGLDTVHLLRKHKSAGGRFADFALLMSVP
jgi:hypothetical protein